MKQTTAIVATVRNMGPPLNSFINYHLAIGFEHLFLFFDDPGDPSIRAASGRSQVTVIRHDDALRQAWKQGKMYDSLREYIPSETMARQQLNVEVAIQLALKKNIDWILHIDGDELFYSPHETVAQHFGSLRDSGIQRVRYLNYEAIPERPDIVDYFMEATLFKVNFLAFSRQWLDAAKLTLIKAIPQLPNGFFRFYVGNKSAARVRETLLPAGPHEFYLPEERLVKINSSIRGQSTGKSPIILHYPCCGFQHFWNKYVTLGQFGDEWYGKVDIRRTVPVHLEGRDVVMKGDLDEAREFFERKFVIRDPADIEKLLTSGLCCRIPEPSQILSGIPSEPGVTGS